MAKGILLNDPTYRWGCLLGETWTLHFIGQRGCAQRILDWLELHTCSWGMSEFAQMLGSLPNEWAIVATSDLSLIAATDKVRSYPLFYTDATSPAVLSNSARTVLEQLPEPEIDSDSVVEFSMAGYVTGSATLFQELKQLQAGEMLVAEDREDSVQTYRYYRYLPRPVESLPLATWIDELATITEVIFKRLIESANGRLLLVPLSGGMDSRLIVCMLRHLGYGNVQTFSYGPEGNYEAKIARTVAKRVGYPWQFVQTTHTGFRKYFWSEKRREYWNFSDGLCAISNMQDIYPLLMLREKSLPGDAIVVNGQAGDFISGGHIPACLLRDGSRETLLDALLDKHFALRKSLRTPTNLAAMEVRIKDSLQEMEVAVGKSLPTAALYESWEWQERQCKYVIGGQRIYDWLGMDWRLPLWDAEYLRFWSRVPFELKLDQRLYKEFLRSRDYCGLFQNFNPTVWRWPGSAMAVLPAAQLIGLLGGRRAKDRFYAHARYIGHYGPYYAPWGWRKFLKEAMDVRNALPFFTETWMEENGIGTPSDTYFRRAMS
jgi:asparagine synthase (glutamine-hydrolysing)